MDDRLNATKARFINQLKRDVKEDHGESLASLVNSIIETAFYYGFECGYTEGEKGPDPEIPTNPVPDDARNWHDMYITKVSNKPPEFSAWLYGQTMPLVEDDPEPTDWAYYADYLRWKNNLPVID